MNCASEKEMKKHCEIYTCENCIIRYKCSLFLKLFGYLPKKIIYPDDNIKDDEIEK